MKEKGEGRWTQLSRPIPGSKTLIVLHLTLFLSLSLTLLYMHSIPQLHSLPVCADNGENPAYQGQAQETIDAL